MSDLCGCTQKLDSPRGVVQPVLSHHDADPRWTYSSSHTCALHARPPFCPWSSGQGVLLDEHASANLSTRSLYPSWRALNGPSVVKRIGTGVVVEQGRLARARRTEASCHMRIVQCLLDSITFLGTARQALLTAVRRKRARRYGLNAAGERRTEGLGLSRRAHSSQQYRSYTFCTE